MNSAIKHARRECKALKLVCKKCGTKISFLKMYAYILGKPNKIKCQNCENPVFDRHHPFLSALHFIIFMLLAILLSLILIRFNVPIRAWQAMLMVTPLVILISPLYYKIVFWYEKQKPKILAAEEESNHIFSSRRNEID